MKDADFPAAQANLQISCSTAELHRRAGQKSPILTNPATPVATPTDTGAAPSSSTDERRKRPGRGALHERLISDYIARNPGTVADHGFAPSVRRLLRRRFRWLTFVPDAYVIDRAQRRVLMVEAQVTSPISAEKWLMIGELFWCFDDSETWTLQLDLIDRAGAVFAVDLPTAAITFTCGTEAQQRDGLRAVTADPPGSLIWPPLPPKARA